MWSLVKKYTDSLEQHSPQPDAQQPAKQTVVLTGATGALGAHILAKLVFDPNVARVYALVRARDDVNARARVAESLKQRRVTTIAADLVEKIVPLASDIDKADLGLTKEQYEEIRTSATAVIAVSDSPVTLRHCLLKASFHSECLVCQFQPFSGELRSGQHQR